MITYFNNTTMIHVYGFGNMTIVDSVSTTKTNSVLSIVSYIIQIHVSSERKDTNNNQINNLKHT